MMNPTPEERAREWLVNFRKMIDPLSGPSNAGGGWPATHVPYITDEIAEALYQGRLEAERRNDLEEAEAAQRRTG